MEETKKYPEISETLYRINGTLMSINETLKKIEAKK
jgi:hypothetical protein